jgi:glucose/arabinose dehydrogenase
MRRTLPGMSGMIVLTAGLFVAFPRAMQAQLPEGAGKATVEAVCSQCHGLDHTINSRYSRPEWDRVVRQMINEGAAIPPDQIGLLIDYLAKYFPQNKAPQAANNARAASPAEFQTVVITRDLEYPWSMAFLPGGDILVTERNAGRLRIIRHGILDPKPITGVPPVYGVFQSGLLDIALHPDFEKNHMLYLAYSKPMPDVPPGVPTLSTMISSLLPMLVRSGSGKRTTAALLRARWDGQALTDVHDIFVTNDLLDDSIPATSGQRLVFGRDGMLYMSVGALVAPASSGPYARATGGRAQDPLSDGGKVLRLRDDGTVPPDNPFTGRAGYLPEIYTMGHRNALGLAVHPTTGEIWEHENGPQDGDEVNILKPGRNYGWPVTGIGHDYGGDFIGGPGAIGAEAGRADAGNYYMPGFEQPFIIWVPAVAPSGMAFYIGDRFPRWKGSLFIGVLKNRRLERHVFNDRGQPVRREYLLEDLKQRIRDVRQGPDGLLYVLTDENPGSLLRLEPVASSR